MKFSFLTVCGKKARIPYKFLLVMKLIVVLMTVTLLSVKAESYAQKVTLSQKNAPLEKVFREIRKQTGYNILCDAEILEDAKLVDISVRNERISEVLDKCFEGQKLTYTIEGNTIVVRRNPFAQTASGAKQITVRGTVKDTAGVTLVGVT